MPSKKLNIIFIILLISFSQIRSEIHWSENELNYNQQGNDWYNLDPVVNRLCKEGTQQSPIDVETDKVVVSYQNPQVSLQFQNHYGMDALEWVHEHALQVNDKQLGQVLYKQYTNQPQAVTYIPQQFHMHSPSEHKINGVQYDLELHVVNLISPQFQGQGYNSYTVTGFLFSAANDRENKFIKQLGLKRGNRFSQKGGINVLLKDFVSNIPNEYYHYKGSLTTPPCSEGINWILYRKVQDISKEQLLYFKQYFQEKSKQLENNTNVADWCGGEGNARDVQPLKGRLVLANFNPQQQFQSLIKQKKNNKNLKVAKQQPQQNLIKITQKVTA